MSSGPERGGGGGWERGEEEVGEGAIVRLDGARSEDGGDTESVGAPAAAAAAAVVHSARVAAAIEALLAVLRRGDAGGAEHVAALRTARAALSLAATSEVVRTQTLGHVLDIFRGDADIVRVLWSSKTRALARS